jgi:hypothetical protein
MPERVGSRGARRTRITILQVAGLGALVVTLVVVSAHDADVTRQEVIAHRGAAVMPFDLDATTHVFDSTSSGGVQTVVADDPTDIEQVALIRSHLRDEVRRFRHGDFGDPASIHGHDMPGLRTLEANADALTISYHDRTDGATVTFSSEDPVIVDALHDWFDAQLHDHGDHARSR